MNKLLLTSLTLTALTLNSQSGFAQTSSQTIEQRTEQRTETTTIVYRNTIANLNRAKNYARQAAEERNGGLRVYRAEALMHGPVEKTRFVENEDGSVTFTFLGGAPGAVPTIESVVTVAINSWQKKVDYNGRIRPTAYTAPGVVRQGSQTVVTQPTQTTRVVYRNTIANLNRAKNYARQAAEERNGGLRVYRAEALMHGPVEKTRFVENEDGSVTFTFFGGAPNAAPTLESIVAVAINGWRTRMIYNGPIRSR